MIKWLKYFLYRMDRFYVSEAIFVAVLFALLVSIPPGRPNCITCQYKSSFGTNSCTIIDNNEINNHTSESSITVTGLESGIPYIFDIGCPEDCCGNYTNTSSTAELHFVQLNSTTLFMNWTGQLPVPNNSFTLCPGFVENLTVYDITVKSLYLNWTVSDCHSPNYLVEWSSHLLNSSDYTTNKSFQITSLLPGTSYIFKVTSVFGDTVGNSKEKSNTTSPAKVGLITLQNSTNSSLTIGWSTPEGHVDSYTINFVRDDLDEPSNKSGLTNNFTVITGLNAGHIYNVTVTSISGSLANVSESEMFATYPNPPEALRVDYQTNISIVLLWSRPSLMDGVNVTYEVSYTPGFYENCSTSFLNLTNLSPGSQYNITVVTIGVLGNRSTPVSLTAYTVPNMVQNLQVSDPSNSSLTLTWLLPNETSSLILYSVNVSSTPAQILNTTSNTLQVTQLQPGTQYNCSVSAIIVAANLFGPLQSVPCSTKPLPVTNLTTSCVKSTEVCLSWSRQLDYKSSYLYNVSVNGGSANQSYNESVNVTDLLPGKSYSFTVQTVANGLGSESVSLSVFTGLDKASNISAVGTTDSMTVAWTPPSGNLTSYIVELLLNGTVQKTKNQTTGIKPFVVFSDLLPGTVYSVIVKSISGSVNQDSDSVSNATLPTAPGVLCVSSLSTNTLYINWTQPLNMTAGSYSFQLQYSNSSSIPSVVNITNSSSSYYYLSGLQAGVQYKITLTTVGALGYSSPAQSVSAYTNPSSVANITVTKFNETSIILSWQQNDTPQDGYSYLLTFTRPNGTNAQMIVNETSAELLSLKSASAFNISIVTQTPGSTRSDPKFQTVYTKPYPVLFYSFVPLNVSAVELNWTRPQENSNGVSYQLLVYSCTENPLNLSSDSETIVVSGLEPGSHCQFSLSSLANGILGTPLSGWFYTDPSAVVLKVDNRGSNESLLVTWDQAVGGVDLYVLNISSFDMNYSINLSSSCENYTLTQLNAATVYTITLTTVRGNFYAPSQPVSMATYPNSPGGITIQEIETRSVSLKWAAALGMKNGSFNYSVTYWSSDNNNNNSYLTPNNVFLLSNLSYGTIYNISVATIGPMGFQSQPVLKNVTTKPDPVQNLNVVSTTTNSISLEWNLVDGVPKYFVTVYSNSSTTRNTTSSNNMILLNLIPGMQYNISVESCTDDGTKGDAVWQTESTDPAQVDNVVCSGPDLLGPMLILSWSRPLGVYQAFGVSLQSSDFFSEVYTTNSSHIFVGLKYHTNYNVTIWTSSFGKNSTKTNIPCQAGITRPFTPDLTMVTVTDVKFNQFTLYFNPGIFNDSNGPVLSYGVLISSNTRDSSVDDTSQLDQSQSACTYSDWKANKCGTYLAVVSPRDLGNAGGESIVIGSQSVWNNYLNGQLDANGVYSYAILFSTKYLSNSSALHTFAAYFSISPFSKGIRMSENPVVIWGSAAGTVVAVLLIGVVVLVMACRRKPKDNDSSNVPIHPLRTKVSDPIKVEDYESYYKRQRADSFCGFAEEFENLRPVGTNQTKTVALAPENKSKNRYNNVLPYDLTRVKLSVLSSPFDDYINANYMPGYSSKKEFIAAQGPLPHTVNDFWRLIWEKNVYTVVMLTRCNEQGRVKCEQYWPADTKHFNNLKVTTTSEIPLEDWTIRDLEVKNMKTSEKRSVRHFHFTAWPDHGVPETTELLIHFRHLVREHMDQYSRHSPTLVHCSAGVGRTGTFIAIDRLIYQIERDGAVDVYGIIHDLRMHRTLMVQTEDQYVFLNQCAMDLIRSRTGNNVDLIYQNTTALSIYENFEPLKKS